MAFRPTFRIRLSSWSWREAGKDRRARLLRLLRLLGRLAGVAVADLDHHDAALDGTAARVRAGRGPGRTPRVHRAGHHRGVEAGALDARPCLTDRRTFHVRDRALVAEGELLVVRPLELFPVLAVH